VPWSLFQRIEGVLTPFQNETIMFIPHAAGKIALITGANRGIGFEVARQLGSLGTTVVIGSRNEALGREAERGLREQNIDARTIRLDVTDEDTIDLGASHINGEFGKLDILVNNAAVLLDDAPPSQLDIDVLRRTYETNVFGTFAVTKAMIPLLCRSDAGRIVNLSSGLGSLTQISDPNYEFYRQVRLFAYNSSKCALNAMSVAFAHELKDTSVKVNAVDPGLVPTEMTHYRGTRTIEQGAMVVVHFATLRADGPTGGFFDENGVVPW
jgi:NAD(P)-dependent dehydrogenase (short-subunit alcohol dehydrogenase family)